MTSPQSIGALDLCPNCTRRVADTLIEYNEVISFTYSPYVVNRRGTRRSARKTLVSGETRLCSQCANVYNRSVALRRLGRRIANWGAAVMAGGAILAFILYTYVPALKQGIAEGLIALPFLFGFICLCIGLVPLAMGTILKRRGTRFLDKQLKSS